MLKDKTIPLYFILFFAILTVIYYPTFFNAPRSDWWESLYFFHTIYANSNPLQLLHILNTDCVQHTSFRPLSHFILYIQHFIFGSNFFYIHVINFVLYCLSLLLLYRLAAVFINNKFLGAVFISYFAFLYSHFDIVSWTAHSYIILGFCFFLLGLILYTKFLKTGSLGSLFLIGILFLSGMFCYEALILWPLSIVILAHIGNLINREKVTKTKLVLSYLLVLALIYIVYMCIFLLIRNIKTYSDSDSRRYALLLQSISIIRIYRTTI